MSRKKKKNLSDQDKKDIAYLYKNSMLPISELVAKLGYHRNTMNKYKNYDIKSRSIKVKQVKPVIEKQQLTEVQKKQDLLDKEEKREDLLIQTIYDECKRGNRFTYEQIRLFLISGQRDKPRYYYIKKFEKLSKYKDINRLKILEEIIDIIFKKFQIEKESLLDKKKDIPTIYDIIENELI